MQHGKSIWKFFFFRFRICTSCLLGVAGEIWKAEWVDLTNDWVLIKVKFCAFIARSTIWIAFCHQIQRSMTKLHFCSSIIQWILFSHFSLFILFPIEAFFCSFYWMAIGKYIFYLMISEWKLREMKSHNTAYNKMTLIIA